MATTLVDVSPNEVLTFCAPPGATVAEDVYTTITIKHAIPADQTNTPSVVYKLKNTSPCLFTVKPIQGILGKNESVKVDVAFDKMAVQGILADQAKGLKPKEFKFLLQFGVTTSEASENVSLLELTKFWGRLWITSSIGLRTRASSWSSWSFKSPKT